MKIKDYKVVSYYLEDDSSIREILIQYFSFYLKNRMCSMEYMDE